MKKNLTDKQVQAYRLVSGEFEGLSTDEAAKHMGITPQAINRLLSRAKKIYPKLFPLLTKQEVDVKALHVLGWGNEDIADKLQVSLSRISQIIGAINEKQNTVCRRPIKMLTYHIGMDSKIRRKF
ncbi:hypothetical protein LCGC14_2184460 [marine sediment metagenome]|uniref:RNA polymerase sigma factor 70 region 4 type 2 domain-containing protein n=1 Tax=marine sediment metagenome TaxID=412755 RepID=A0A0F9E8E1_9ZZZZ